MASKKNTTDLAAAKALVAESLKAERETSERIAAEWARATDAVLKDSGYTMRPLIFINGVETQISNCEVKLQFVPIA